MSGNETRVRACWLGRRMIEALADVNHLCLALLAEQALAAGPSGRPGLRQVGELWRALDERSRRQVGACPFLLLDAGFTDPQRWRWPDGLRVADASPAAGAPFFTVPKTVAVARTVFVYAWSLVVSQPDGARVILGIHPECASLLAACTVPQVHGLAERACSWLRPRWLNRMSIWRKMLVAAAEDDEAGLVRARMHGLQISAAQVWDAARRSPGGPWGLPPSVELQ